MINEIIDGISVAINSEFGDSYEIYTEAVEQGLEEPCFSIICLNPKIEQFFGKRYFRSNQFCIHYFPSGSEKRSECYSASERLFKALEYITVGSDLCRGTNFDSEVEDGVLHFFVNYDMFVYKQQEALPIMESLEYDTDVKG